MTFEQEPRGKVTTKELLITLCFALVAAFIFTMCGTYSFAMGVL